MLASALEKLFFLKARATLSETARLLHTPLPLEEIWEAFFQRLHGLKAMALSSGQQQTARLLHQMEGSLWRKAGNLDPLFKAQVDLENIFGHRPSSFDIPTLPSALRLLARELERESSLHLRKNVQVKVEVDHAFERTPAPWEGWSAYLHLCHNALIHGTGALGTLILRANLSNGDLVLEVEDDGSGESTHQSESLYAGWGVGLRAAGMEAQNLGGRLEKNSTPTGGTCAGLRLPYQKTA